MMDKMAGVSLDDSFSLWARIARSPQHVDADIKLGPDEAAYLKCNVGIEPPFQEYHVNKAVC